MNVTPPVEGVALSVPSLPAVPRSSQRSRCEGVGVEGGGIRMTVLCTYPEPPRLSRPLPETPEDEQEYLLPPRKPPKGKEIEMRKECDNGSGDIRFKTPDRKMTIGRDLALFSNYKPTAMTIP